MFYRQRRSIPGKAVILFMIVLIVAGITGCASSDSMPGAARDKGEIGSPAPAEQPAMEASAPSYSQSSLGNGIDFDGQDSVSGRTEESLPGNSGERRYMVQSARLTLEITDLEEAAESIRAGVEQAGGYIVSLNFYDLTSERRMGQVSLRVPEDKYSQVMLMLQELGEIKNIEESASDVTMEYIDLEARIGNLQAQEQRIRELLERAKDIEEILQIEKELTRIRGDLESMQGEFKYLRERVNFSSIFISLEEKDPREYAVVDEFSTFGEDLAERFSLNTNRMIKGLTGMVLAVLASLPFLLPLAVLGVLLWKAIVYLRRKNEKKHRKEKSTGTIL